MEYYLEEETLTITEEPEVTLVHHLKLRAFNKIYWSVEYKKAFDRGQRLVMHINVWRTEVRDVRL